MLDFLLFTLLTFFTALSSIGYDTGHTLITELFTCKYFLKCFIPCINIVLNKIKKKKKSLQIQNRRSPNNFYDAGATIKHWNR